ncbi:MAG: hypothetical protein GF416_01870 [Candidatus Altiarchaeales archaeon]|nr:hypothetical protein [Candidatus Altiarchaeales archaeon]MBD3415864.1 hypothetical protein [Candidatus Altiarchaeales archaeon]
MDEGRGKADKPMDLLERLNSHYGSSYQPRGTLTIKKDKLFEYTGPDTDLNTYWMGLHLANADLSLTIEGAQRLGITASENVLVIKKAEADRYYGGEDLEGHLGGGFTILKTRDLVVGPGLLEDGRVKNILPKSRKTRR